MFFILLIIVIVISIAVYSRSTVVPASLEGVKTGQTDQVTYLARLYRFSGSGDMRFQPIESAGVVQNPSSYDDWFFAQPRNVPSDARATDAWVKFIQENSHSEFIITGRTIEYDCDYSSECVEVIEIDTIGAVE